MKSKIFITALFLIIGICITPEIRYYYRTNRVIIIEPGEDEENCDQ